MPPDRLLPLFQRKYSLLLLAELARREGAKVVTLARALGASRAAVRAALDDLASHGWVTRNPGYGHPLRPEFLPTPDGARLGESCGRIHELLAGEAGRRVATRKWALPVLLTLGTSPAERFSDLAARLPGITDRALSAALSDLEDAGLVKRSVVDGRPPRAVYRVTPSGRSLLPPLEELG